MLQEVYVDRVDEELAKLRANRPERVVIARDDKAALSTKDGWEWYQSRAEMLSAGSPPAVPNANYWVARLSSDASKQIDIECERWNDARAFARMVAGGREVTVHRLSVETIGVDRWQVRWAGSSMDPRDPPHLAARRLAAGDDELENPFLPVREIRFG